MTHPLLKLLLLSPLLLSLSPPTLAQPAPSPHHQLQQAQTSLHQGDSQHAIKLAQQILHTTPNPKLQAIALGIATAKAVRTLESFT
jgi:histone deacetylase complex regulatory component SIN3